MSRYVDDFEKESVRAGAPPDRAAADAWASLARVVLTSNVFLYVD
jgi:hypothetical protein